MTEYSTPATVAIDARTVRDQTTGKGRYTRGLIENLLKLDDKLQLHLITHPTAPNPVSSPRVRTTTFPAHPNGPASRFVLPHWADLDDVDLFHSSFNFLPRNISAPSVFTLHDIMWLINPSYCTKTWWNKWISAIFYEQVIPPSVHEAEEIYTVSNHAREMIEEYFPSAEGRVKVTYNGVDPDFAPIDEAEANQRLRGLVPEGARFVLIVGRGSPHKNHARAVDGFIRAFGDDPDMHLVLLRKEGNTPATRLEELLAKPALQSRLHRLDYVSGDELRALYSAAEIFLFPSLHEGFGLPILEAMASGTPVVTANRGAMGEVAGEAGVRVDPVDTDEIADGLRRLADDGQLWDEKRDAGLERAAEFTWKRCARQTLESYRRVLGES